MAAKTKCQLLLTSGAHTYVKTTVTVYFVQRQAFQFFPHYIENSLINIAKGASFMFKSNYVKR